MLMQREHKTYIHLNNAGVPNVLMRCLVVKWGVVVVKWGVVVIKRGVVVVKWGAVVIK